jgi:hypothetical protein
MQCGGMRRIEMVVTRGIEMPFFDLFVDFECVSSDLNLN